MESTHTDRIVVRGRGTPSPNEPLPATWYSDEEITRRERRLLFDRGPGYVGHRSMVGKPGTYSVVPPHGDTMLVHDDEGLRLLSNVCLHRGGLMRSGRGGLGPQGRTVCPWHKWVYSREGELIGAPNFDPAPCGRLPSRPVRSWNGLLFSGPRDPGADLAALRGFPGIQDTSDWVLARQEVDEQPTNWKIPLEVFLDNLHVAVIHPGFRRFVDCSEVASGVRTLHSERFSVQTVGPADGLRRSGSEPFQRWQKLILEVGDGRPPEFGATWLFYYPNLMIEWYPYTFIVSSFQPLSAERTAVITETFYPRRVLREFPEFVEAERASGQEVQDEDDELILALHQGRRSLAMRGEPMGGHWHPVMEEGLRRFHGWVRDELGG